MKFRVVGGIDSGLNSPGSNNPDATATQIQTRERRRATRQGAHTKVILHHPAIAEETCETRNLSKSGAFVVTPDAASLARGTLLDVTFVVDQVDIIKVHHLTAIVAQTQPEGVGLKLLPGKR